MQLQRCQTPAWNYVDYLLTRPESFDQNTPVILLLHGFEERAQRIFRKLSPAIPNHYAILAPNGPFPLPKRIKGATSAEDYYRIGHAWYFYDDIKDSFFIDYSFPVNILKSLMQTLKLEQNPLTIVGYSQGGYLAPFVGQACSQTEKVIGINCRFREDMLEINPPLYPIHALHGEKDDRVCLDRSQNAFKQLLKRGYNGTYQILPKKNHDLDEDFITKLKELI